MFADRLPTFVLIVYWQYADSVPTCVAYLAVSASLMGIVMLPERCRGEWQWQAQTAMMVYDKGRLRGCCPS